jgi:hypothetical protein
MADRRRIHCSKTITSALSPCVNCVTIFLYFVKKSIYMIF